MPTINIHKVQTRNGSLCLYAKSGVLFADAGRPVLLMIHGALQNSAARFDWIGLCDSEFDVVFIDLPGHGRSPSTTNVTIESFAAGVGDAVTTALSGRAVVIVGESLGGLVALAVGGLHIEPVQAIVAVDPPMTMGKLWHIRSTICSAVANNPGNQFLQSFALNIFGIGSDGKTHERIYYDLIEHAKVPILILTGDVPLFPMRTVDTIPCLIEDVDRYVIERLFGDSAQFEVIQGCGHVLLVNAKQECRSKIVKFYDTVRSRNPSK